MKRTYRTLLRLYPADYRAMFAAEMLRAFDRVAEERRGFLVKECAGAIAGAGAEWIAKWTTDASVRGCVSARPADDASARRTQGAMVSERRMFVGYFAVGLAAKLSASCLQSLSEHSCWRRCWPTSSGASS